MPATFPPLRPTERRFAPGILPQTVARTYNQRVVRRPMASGGGGSQLELVYENITDDQVEQIRQAYQAARGPWAEVTLPPEVWAGDGPLAVFAAFLPANYYWRFQGDVEVEWVKRGRATATVRFVNYARTQFALPPPPVIGPPPVLGVTQCLWHQNLIPQVPGALAHNGTAALAMSDGSVVVAGVTYVNPSNTDTLTWHISKFAKDGTIIWQKKLIGPYYVDNTYDSPTRSPNICEGSNGDVFFAASSGNAPGEDRRLRIYLFRIDANGVVVQQANTIVISASNKEDAAVGVQEGGHIMYLPVENKIMMLGQRGYIYVYNATTLALEQYRVLQPSVNVINNMCCYVPNRGRVLLGYGRHIIEISPDALTNHQGWALTHTTAISTDNNLQAIFIDSFGGLWSAYSDTVSNVYLTRHSASEGAYAPIATYKWSVNGSGTSNVFIDQLSTGEIVLVRHNIGVTLIRAYVLSPDGTTVKATTTYTLSSVSGTSTYQWFKGKMIDEDDYLLVGVWSNGSCMRLPIKAVANNTQTLVTTTGSVTISVSTDYTESPTPAHTSIPSVLSYLTAPSAQTIQSTLSGLWSTGPMADLWSYETTKKCTTFNEVSGFCVSETTTTGAEMAIGGNNWYYQTSLTTAAGSIYFAGLATVATVTKWFISKYDSDLNLLWSNWLEGPYVAGTLPSNSGKNGAALAEGPADGVFMTTKGKSSINNTSLGASFRIYLFTAAGALQNTAAWQVGPNEFGFTKVQEDEPAAALYVASQDRLYVRGQNHLHTTMRGLTLDQAFSVDGGSSGQNRGHRIFWLEDKQRVVFAGGIQDVSFSGMYVGEYSPDLRTRYQYYGYPLGTSQAASSAIDQFGGIYLVELIAITNVPVEVQLTKLSGSDGGYLPVWSRKFTVTPSAGGFITSTGISLEILPDGRLVVAVTQPSQSSTRTMRVHFFTIDPTGANIIARTTLLWGGVYPPTRYEGGINLTREVATFIAGPFSLGKTSLKLPAIDVNLLLGSTTGAYANKNMTAQTRYDVVPLTDVATPTRSVIPALSRDCNPMAQWGEAAWTTTDLTATVQFERRCTGPLQVPAP